MRKGVTNVGSRTAAKNSGNSEYAFKHPRIELSDIFSVTEETIRRDLEKLEKEHKLSRSHGGAVSIQQQESEVHFSEREITNVIEKKPSLTKRPNM